MRMRVRIAMLALVILESAAPSRLGADAPPCDDGNPCTDDAVVPVIGCSHTPNTAPCEDGDPCTTGDACQGGACVAGPIAPPCVTCRAATAIPAEGGSFDGTTSGAGTLAGSCGGSDAPEQVFRWTPSASGVALITTCEPTTGFDTVVYLRSGDCTTGPEIACNDDRQGGCTAPGGSQLTPTLTAGQTYYIVVDGAGGAHGPFTLTVVPPAQCGNGVREGLEQCDGPDHAACSTGQCSASCTCVPPQGALPDLTVSISGVVFQRSATVSPGDVAEGCAERTTDVDLLRFTVQSANAGAADLALGDPQCPAPCSAHPDAPCGNPDFICSPSAGHNHPHYTDYARYELRDEHQQTVVVGHKQGYCLRDSSCAGTGYPHYTCLDQGIGVHCSDVYEAGLGCQYLDVTGVAAGTYELRVTVDPLNRIPESREDNNVAAALVTIPGRGVPTTTTVPCTGDTACDDGDACTADRCVAGSCRHEALADIDAVRCAVAVPLGGPACDGQPLPAGIARRWRRARVLIDEAQHARRRARAQRLVARAARALERAEALVARIRSGAEIADGCATSLTRALGDAAGRAMRFARG